MVYPLLNEPYTLKFYSAWPSKSSCLVVLLQALVLLLPLLLQLTERTLFHQVEQYQEQPLLQHRDTLLQATLLSSSLAYSSTPLFHPFIQAPLPALVSATALRDTNQDGTPDQFLANLTFKAKPQEVSEVQIVFLVDLETRQTVKMQAQSLVSLQVSSAQGISSARVTGSFALLQKTPLQQNDFVDFTYNSSMLLSPQDTPLPTLSLLVENNLRRNISLALHPVTTSIVPATPSSSDTVSIEVVLKIPPVTLMFYPRISKVLFSVWLKYLAVFLPLQALYYYLLRILFSSQAMFSYHSVQMLPKQPLR